MTEMSLTRAQVQQLATFFALDLNIHGVTIRESHETGIGASHRATLHKAEVARDFEADITDVSNW
jgi:hypothetical protein